MFIDVSYEHWTTRAIGVVTRERILKWSGHVTRVITLKLQYEDRVVLKKFLLLAICDLHIKRQQGLIVSYNITYKGM